MTMEDFRTKCINGWRVIAGLLSGIAMLSCFSLGFFKMAAALYAFRKESPVAGILAGLELFFLAPLPYLSLMALTNYLEAVVENDKVGMEIEYPFLQRAKHLVFGLMIAVLATSGIEMLVSKSESVEFKLVIPKVIGSGFLILVIALHTRWSQDKH
jgi:hypothetical protein